MNKQELIDIVANKAGLTKKDTKSIVDAMLETITETLVKNDTVAFIGFGTFKTTIRSARTAKVPGSTRTVEVPETKVVKFAVGKELKNLVAAK